MKKGYGSALTYIIETARGLVLEVGELNRDVGGIVRIWGKDGGDAQQWRFEPAYDEYYKIRNVFSGKLLDVAMQGTDNGTWVHQWDDTGSDSQLWSVVPARGPGGGSRLCNKHSGSFLDIIDGADAEGSRVQIWENRKGLVQRWSVIQVNK